MCEGGGVELRHLRYFLAVAEEQHFGRAAKRLHMAQPPLSHQIRQLEAELGVRLLDRTTRRVSLTEAGTAYLERVRGILAEVAAAGEQARRVADGTEGRLVVGCVGSATYSLLPVFARAVREELPGIDLGVRGEMLVPAQVRALQAGEIDLALLRPPVDEPGVRLTRLRDDRFVVALPDAHPLAGRKRLRVADLEGLDLVVHAEGRSVMHAAVVELCREAGFEARVAHEVTETSTLVTFVAAGLGAAVVPEPVARLGVPGVTFCPLAARDARIELAVGRRSDEDSPTVARAVELVCRLSR